MLDAVEGPMSTLVPGLNQLAESLTSPPMVNLSDDLGDFLKVLGELGRRMQPLTQLAESAFKRSLSNLSPGPARHLAPGAAAPEGRVPVAAPLQRSPPVAAAPVHRSPPELAPAAPQCGHRRSGPH
jgi:hypothetical protein